MIDFSVTPLEQPCATSTARRRLTIGLPRPQADSPFPLTPEGCARLVERGFRVIMQERAAASINYPDARFSRRGVEIVASGAEAWGADVVIMLAAPTASEIRLMRRGGMLLTLLRPESQDPEALREMLSRHIVSIALDLVTDSHGCHPFADILDEIEGRACALTAASLLAGSDGTGKSILLGGVTGVVPCEVVIIGSGIGAIGAARSALGMGALVRMFDNDVYGLRTAQTALGQAVVGSALHPHTLDNALRSADVVIVTPTDTPVVFTRDDVSAMKSGVLCLDASRRPGSAFSSLPVVDLADAASRDAAPFDPGRKCYIHAGRTVARTTAMALSNTLMPLLADLIDCDGMQSLIRLLPGLRAAAMTFSGKPVNVEVAERVGMRFVDISIFLTLS